MLIVSGPYLNMEGHSNIPHEILIPAQLPYIPLTQSGIVPTVTIVTQYIIYLPWQVDSMLFFSPAKLVGTHTMVRPISPILFFTYNSNLIKIIQIVTYWSPQNFSLVMTAVLSWQVQSFVAISWPAKGLQQNIFFHWILIVHEKL